MFLFYFIAWEEKKEKAVSSGLSVRMYLFVIQEVCEVLGWLQYVLSVC